MNRHAVKKKACGCYYLNYRSVLEYSSFQLMIWDWMQLSSSNKSLSFRYTCLTDDKSPQSNSKSTHLVFKFIVCIYFQELSLIILNSYLLDTSCSKTATVNFTFICPLLQLLFQSLYF